jgi:class 3 adenylate cyclase
MTKSIARTGKYEFHDATSSLGVVSAERDLEPFVYMLRLAGISWALAVCAYWVIHFDRVRFYHVAFLAVVLTYPHVAHLLYRRKRSRAQQLAFLLLDAFLLGCTIYFASFSLFVTLTATAIAVGNALALNGFLWAIRAFALLAAGAGTFTVFAGSSFEPRSIPQIDLLCSVFLLGYFLVFAYATYTRSMQLLRSRRELREQKVIAEIERKRAEGFLLSLLPASLIQEFKQNGAIRPRSYSQVTLLSVDFPNLGEMQKQRSLDSWVGEFNHYLQAFDAIAGRYRLETLRGTGEGYLAVGGIPDENPLHAQAALNAAEEMLEFAAGFVSQSSTETSCRLAVRIVVHTGELSAGVIETRQFYYTVWGPAIEEAQDIRSAIAPWQVAFSETTRAQLASVPATGSEVCVAGENGKPLRIYLLTSERALLPQMPA